MTDSGRIKILILCPYPKGSVPGQRFRFEQYLDILREAGIDTDIEPFLSEQAMRILYQRGHFLSKAMGVLGGFLRRFSLTLRSFRYDYVFIHREASPLGPPIFESLMFLLRRKVVYDFDDAIFVPQSSTANPFLRPLKWTSKVRFICKHCWKVSVCNPYLVDWVSQYHRNVVLIPTTIDSDYHRPPNPRRAPNGRIVVGWTGSHSTAKFLEIVRPALRRLQQDRDFEFRVICDHDPGFPELKNYRFIPWKLESEIEDLAAFDVGLMPVPEGPWEKGKVGFKGIQYSAMGIAPVVSSVGSGGEVVKNGETGFVVDNTETAWHDALDRLLEDRNLIAKFGAAAREYIVKRYSVAANAANYIGLFKDSNESH